MLGRYIQSDPIGLNGGLDTCGYVGGDALGSIDKKGLWSKPAHEGFQFWGGIWDSVANFYIRHHGPFPYFFQENIEEVKPYVSATITRMNNAINGRMKVMHP